MRKSIFFLFAIHHLLLDRFLACFLQKNRFYRVVYRLSVRCSSVYLFFFLSDGQTDKQTDKWTDRQTKVFLNFCNRQGKNALNLLWAPQELLNVFYVFCSEVAFDLPTTAMSANMNAYVDLVMIQVGPWILRNGWVPMNLPDFIEQIEHRVILITYHGELHLTRGVLNRLVSVARSGNAVMTYERKMLRIAVAGAVRQIAVSFLLLIALFNV
jgi:hypothetical protein